MATTTKSSIQKKDGSINLLDLFFYLLSYWYLFLLAIAVCVGFAAYKYATANLVYSKYLTLGFSPC